MWTNEALERALQNNAEEALQFSVSRRVFEMELNIVEDQLFRERETRQGLASILEQA